MTLHFNPDTGDVYEDGYYAGCITPAPTGGWRVTFNGEDLGEFRSLKDVRAAIAERAKP